jgi:hypothetical protein
MALSQKLSLIGSSIEKTGKQIFGIGLVILVLSLIAAFLFGCTTVTERSRRQYVLEHPGLKADIKEVISKGELTLGMSTNDVLATWGQPADKKEYRSASGEFTEWIYGNCLYACTILYFDKTGGLYNFHQQK